FTAAIAARAASWLIERLGGYHVSQIGLAESLMRRDLLPGVIQSASTLIWYLPELYRCALPADLTTGSALLWACCLIVPALMIFALVRGCPISSRRMQSEVNRPADFVAHTLWFAALLGMAAFLANSVWKDRATMRYLIPSVLSGATLTGRIIAGRVRRARTP